MRHFVLVTLVGVAGCGFIGAATMPDAKPDPVAKVTAIGAICEGVRYNYKILLTGKSYVMPVHTDPLGVLLYGHWEEVPMDSEVCVDSLAGEYLARDLVIDGYRRDKWTGSIRFSENHLYVHLISYPKDQEQKTEIPYRFNGEYSLVQD